MQFPPPINRATQRIIYIDYLRIFACIGVFACHLWVSGILPALNPLTQSFTSLAPECLGIHGDALYRCGFDAFFPLPSDRGDHLLFNSFNLLFGLGYQAVHLFFILSGFGLALSALLSEKKTPQIRWFSFLKKRLLRLYPSYWIILAVYLLINAAQYQSTLGLLKTYIKGSIFLDILPATWYIPILLQLYLLFPFLFSFLKKLSIPKFLTASLLVKVVSSASIIIVSMLSSEQIAGFGYGALAPGGVALTRLFEFCFGMAIAKHWVEQGCSNHIFSQFRKPSIIALGIFLECSGLFLSLKYTVVQFGTHAIPIGLFISDALIGVGVFILSLNLMFVIHSVLKIKNTSKLDLIGNGTYEAYLVHGFLLEYFVALLVVPVLQLLGLTPNYLGICLLYLIALTIFSLSTLSLGCGLFNLKFYLIKKTSLRLG